MPAGIGVGSLEKTAFDGGLHSRRALPGPQASLRLAQERAMKRLLRGRQCIAESDRFFAFLVDASFSASLSFSKIGRGQDLMFSLSAAHRRSL